MDSNFPGCHSGNYCMSGYENGSRSWKGLVYFFELENQGTGDFENYGDLRELGFNEGETVTISWYQMSDEESCTNPSGDNNGCRQHTGVGFYKAFKRDWWVNNGGYQGFHTNGDVSAGLTGYGGTAFEYTNSGPYVWEKFEYSFLVGDDCHLSGPVIGCRGLDS